MVSAGTCTLRATQPGNATYASAFADTSFTLYGAITNTVTYEIYTVTPPMGAPYTVSVFNPSGDIFANVVLNSGTLDLQGQTLTIYGNLIQTGGVLKVNGGRLNVRGNYLIQVPPASFSGGQLLMQNTADYVEVDGNFVMASTVNHHTLLTAGTLEVKGNFTQVGANNWNFSPVGTHRVLLSGTASQTVNFATPRYVSDVDYYSYFNILEITNSSTAGLIWATAWSAKTLLNSQHSQNALTVNGTSWLLSGYETVKGNLQIQSTMVDLNGYELTVQGDVTLSGGTLDLHGATMTITGNLIQTGGVLKVNGGRLNVRGNYLIQVPPASFSGGQLLMQNTADYVEVDGNFVMASTVNHHTLLTAGTLEVKGNFTQVGANNWNFSPVGTHRVLLSGTASQTVNFATPRYVSDVDYYSYFNILEITNSSTAGLIWATAWSAKTLLNSQHSQNALTVNGTSWLLSGYETVKGNLQIQSTMVDLNGYELTVQGDVTLSGGTLDLHGATMTITGNLIQTGGVLKVNGGRLNVRGNYLIQVPPASFSGGQLLMQNTADYVEVDGNFVMASTVNHHTLLTAGTLEVKGNFTQVGANNWNFSPVGTHRVLLSGTASQTVNFATPRYVSDVDYYSYFNILEITNSSTAGLIWATAWSAKTLLNSQHSQNALTVNGTSWLLSGYETVKGNLQIQSTMVDLNGYELTVQGDVTLSGGTLDLHGATMTITGNLIQTGGVLKVNGGRLNVRGNYLIQVPPASFSGGQLLMQNTADYVEVDGNFVMASTVNHHTLLTAGTLEVKGNFTQVGANNWNFSPVGTHRVLLSGTASQTVNFATPRYVSDVDYYSYFNILEITNSSTAGLIWATAWSAKTLLNSQHSQNALTVNGTSWLLSGYETVKGNLQIQSTMVDLNGYELTVQGDVTLSGGTLDLHGATMTITGNLIQTGGVLKVNGGRLNVRGNYLIQVPPASFSGGQLLMQNTADYVEVDGNFVMASTVNHHTLLTAGTLEVKGNFTQVGANNWNFSPVGTHRVLLSGTASQTVNFATPRYVSDVDYYSYFNILEITNSSTAGLIWATAWSAKTLLNSQHSQNALTVNGTSWLLSGYETVKGNLQIQSTMVDLNGYELTVQGDVTLSGGTLDLHGATMTITGNLIQTGGVLKVNGGRLNVRGNYLIQVPPASFSGGQLLMQNTADYVEVDGNFVMASTVNHHTLLTAGTLEVKGNFTQVGANNWNFSPVGTHRVLLSGTASQTVNFATPRYVSDVDYYSYFNILEITNSSTAGLIWATAWSAKTLLNSQHSQNALTVNGTSWLLSGYETVKGNLQIQSTMVDLNGYELTVQGDVTLSGGTLDLHGATMTITGNLIQTGGVLKVNGGRLNVRGNYLIQVPPASFSGGQLLMQNTADYVEVDGNFVMASTVNHHTLLTAGTLEVKGNFTQVGANNWNFSPVGTHRVLLSGTASQTVNFATPRYVSDVDYYSYFNILEITNSSTAGLIWATAWSAKTLLNSQHSQNALTVNGTSWLLSGYETVKGNLQIQSTMVDLNGYELTVQGDVTLSGGTLDLHGATMTITGNLIQTGGVLKVNGGRLNVRGNYLIQVPPASFSGGQLLMQNTADYVEVDGNFVMASTVNHHTLLTAGTLEVKGNFTQVGANNWNFSPVGTHRVLLSGTASQTVNFATPRYVSDVDYYSYFNVLEWTGSFSRLVFASAYFVRTQTAQSITFPTIPNKLSNATPFTITATGGGSGLPVTFTTSTSAVCTVATASGTTTVTLVGIAGTCTINANQAGGLGYTAAPPVSQSFTVTLYVPLVLQSVKSRKTHGTAGSFDVTIDLTKALDADISVDPRNSGGAHQLIFTFNLPITSVGGVTATGTGGSPLGSVNHFPSSNVVTVNLSDIPDARRVKVALTGLNGGALAEAAANVGFLIGDVTGNGSVTAADIMGIKTRFVTTVTNANFRADINLNGSVNAQDVSQAKSRAGMRLQ